MAKRGGGRWTNWAETASCAPAATGAPADEDELAALVKGAAAEGRRVKAHGAGHSFTGAALTDGLHLSLDGMERGLDVDPSTGLVTVEAGTPPGPAGGGLE